MSVRLGEVERRALAEMLRWARRARLGEHYRYLTGAEGREERQQLKAAARWVCAAGLAVPHYVRGVGDVLVRTSAPWLPHLAVRRCATCKRPAEPVRLFCGPNCGPFLMKDALYLEDLLDGTAARPR